MRVSVEAAQDNKFCTSSWSSDSWLTILHTLRKELNAAAAVFPELKDYTIDRPQPQIQKKRGK